MRIDDRAGRGDLNLIGFLVREDFVCQAIDQSPLCNSVSVIVHQDVFATQPSRCEAVVLAINFVVVLRETTVRALQPVVFLLRVTHRIFGCAQFCCRHALEPHLAKIGQRDLHQTRDIWAFAQQR